MKGLVSIGCCGLWVSIGTLTLLMNSSSTACRNGRIARISWRLSASNQRIARTGSENQSFFSEAKWLHCDYIVNLRLGLLGHGVLAFFALVCPAQRLAKDLKSIPELHCRNVSLSLCVSVSLSQSLCLCLCLSLCVSVCCPPVCLPTCLSVSIPALLSFCHLFHFSPYRPSAF